MYKYCRKCKQPLRSAESRKRGYGPKCWAEVAEEQMAEFKRTAMPMLAPEPTESGAVRYLLDKQADMVRIIGAEFEKHQEEVGAHFTGQALEVLVYAGDRIEYGFEHELQRHLLIHFVKDKDRFRLVSGQLKRWRQERIADMADAHEGARAV